MSCPTNVITAYLGGGNTTTAPLYQWDYGQVLRFTGVELPMSFSAHFSNQPIKSTAQSTVAYDGQVEIPDEYLTSGQNVYAWVYLHAGLDDGETEYAITIPVIRRPQPVNETPTPAQQSEIDQAIAALNAAVTLAEGYADDAEGFADDASGSAGNASQSAEDAEAWAVGKRGGVDVPDTDPTYENNSKYYAGQSRSAADDAMNAEEESIFSALRSEGFAVGQRAGQDVGNDSPYYHNNSKWYSEVAADNAQAAAGSARDADDAADRAEQAAASAGYMFFGIDSRGHVILDKTPNVPVDFELVDGHLIVEAV